MLELKGITKNYYTKFETVEALKGINLNFRKNEFVSILGPSGCGKTTLLNVIGGLDQYTTGDLIICGKSTKEYTSKDWDNYRNHSIGFVFQTYNLIPHLTILENVELALTISGVGKKERVERSKDVLEKVGLGDKLNVLPNQLSGGQMQRVAIARALVNNPEILLADEPTGALDTKTSVQILDLLKEISKEKLVIMVTHNPDLAKEYSTRIIKLLDGEIVGDTNPYEVVSKEERKEEKGKQKKASMSFFTALGLSFKNLLTKKARTFLVGFAGSIGIIGIALILSMSNGFQLYIDKVQEDTLSTYPLTVEETTVDMTTIIENMTGKTEENHNHDNDKVYTNIVVTEMLESLMKGQIHNDLKKFKEYIETDESKIKEYTSDIKYSYNLDINVYSSTFEYGVVQVNPSSVYEGLFSAFQGTSSFATTTTATNVAVFNEMIDNRELLESQYEVIAGSWPKNYNEVVFKVDDNNEIADYLLYALGFKDPKELEEILDKITKGEEVEVIQTSYSYEEILNRTFKVVLQPAYYTKDEERGAWDDNRDDEEYLKRCVENGIELKIVGIVRENPDAVGGSIQTVIGYTSDLTKYVIEEINKCQIVKEQKENPEVDVFTGNNFDGGDVTIDEINAVIDTLPDAMKQMFNAYYASMVTQYGEEEAKKELVKEYKKYFSTENTYEKNLETLGVNDLSSPSRISFYPVDFESKDKIIGIIDEYNAKQIEEGHEEDTIHYTDYIGILLSGISDVVNAVTYVLIAFVAISLVVSSIMIAVITYISVLERIKEIGILRSVGASKLDITNVFNAETLIIGLFSGTLGILITILLDIPINIIINHFAKIGHIAKLPIGGAIGLVAISIFLSFISGLIPAIIAAKKDPVVALRTE